MFQNMVRVAVSVKIWAVNKALFVLAHELGHVKYQVPHLASYINEYKKYYSIIMTRRKSYRVIIHGILAERVPSVCKKISQENIFTS